MWGDILTALAVTPFGVALAFFVFIFLEWSKESDSDEDHMYEGILRFWQEHTRPRDRR